MRKYAQFFSSKHSSVIFRDSTSGALANKLYFSRQNTAVLIFHDLSSGALKTQEFWFVKILLPACSQIRNFSRQNTAFWFFIIFTLISTCFLGTSKGYGLVKYASKASSIQARHVLEGYQVRDGHTLDCDWLQHNRPVDTVTSLHSKCLYVDQLPADYRDMAQFRRLFSKVVNPPYCQVSSLRPFLSSFTNLDILFPIICSVQKSASRIILRLRKCQILGHYLVLGNIHKLCLIILGNFPPQFPSAFKFSRCKASSQLADPRAHVLKLYHHRWRCLDGGPWQ